jgi:quinohemoprotein ethanol dehydrogenase
MLSTRLLAAPSLTRLTLFVVGVLSLASPPPTCAADGGLLSKSAVAAVSAIDDAALKGAEEHLSDWLTHGRTYSEQRFSPLNQVTDANVRNLRSAWTFETGLSRGHEATPIVVGGVMYLTGSWSIVIALDAKTGEELWRYDPKVPKTVAAKACCDVVNRGVAVFKGRVFSGTLDGRLVALDASSGTLVWEKVTVDQEKAYTITGAPRVVAGNIIIGNGGADLGVRGYVSAYSADDGELVWRTYTVPSDPSLGFESEALRVAAETWKGGRWWEIGGGGTAWDSMAYDPDLDLLYVGTGNGSPWVRHIRSPGGGDNLYLSSILALRPATGELVWHYQTTPGDTWDFTATQHLILADLMIDGRERKVIVQAPKNGFFYVIDRTDGSFISADNYVTTTWADGVDPKTGRPNEVPGQDFKDELALVSPTPFGGHNWQPMSFSPQTGLVYIPAQEIVGIYRRDKNFKVDGQRWNTGTDFNVYSMLTPDLVHGLLVAWDPVTQKEVWSQYHASGWNGGTLATAGNLVFQGTADGRFVAYAADNGKALWEAQVGTGMGAGPISYMVDGQQYVAVVAGWGGVFALAGGEAAAQGGRESNGRVLAWKITTPEFPSAADIAAVLDTPGDLADGQRLFHKHCAVCHGAMGVSSNDAIPDLRKSRLPYAAFDRIVREGLMEGAGMPHFGGYLDASQTQLVKTWLEGQRDGASR